ncbi:MAG: hypothetical protein DA329_07645 [Candidatus Nitrosocosmicus sp.]|nr:hypothetical protein [Candidatus Nitrosocosmicus sp.]
MIGQFIWKGGIDMGSVIHNLKKFLIIKDYRRYKDQQAKLLESESNNLESEILFDHNMICQKDSTTRLSQKIKILF